MKALSLFSILALLGLITSTPSPHKTPLCQAASRAISSVEKSSTEETSESQVEVEADLEEKVSQVCQQEEQILALKEDLNKLQKERERILETLEKLEEPKEESKEKNKKDTQVSVASTAPTIIIINNSWPSMAPQLQTPAPISYGYSPFHNMSQNSLSNYLQMAMAHRLNFSMSENDYWHPEWDASGNMTNPQYGLGGSTWGLLETMYREPTSNQSPTNNLWN